MDVPDGINSMKVSNSCQFNRNTEVAMVLSKYESGDESFIQIFSWYVTNYLTIIGSEVCLLCAFKAQFRKISDFKIMGHEKFGVND